MCHLPTPRRIEKFFTLVRNGFKCQPGIFNLFRAEALRLPDGYLGQRLLTRRFSNERKVPPDAPNGGAVTRPPSPHGGGAGCR